MGYGNMDIVVGGIVVIRSRHDDDFVITGGYTGCCYDNLQCHQWWQIWHHGWQLLVSVQLPHVKTEVNNSFNSNLSVSSSDFMRSVVLWVFLKSKLNGLGRCLDES